MEGAHMRWKINTDDRVDITMYEALKEWVRRHLLTGKPTDQSRATKEFLSGLPFHLCGDIVSSRNVDQLSVLPQ